MEYTISDKVIHIQDSYKIKTKKEMTEILNSFREQYPENYILKTRSNSSLIREWKGHNFLYELRLFRSHTKDVDLDDNTCIILMTGYWFLALGYDFINIF